MDPPVRTPTPPPEVVEGGESTPLKDTEGSSQASPRKRRRMDYALGLGDGREFVIAKMSKEDKPKLNYLLTAILERDPNQRAKNWNAQQMATWLHDHPVNAFISNFSDLFIT